MIAHFYDLSSSAVYAVVKQSSTWTALPGTLVGVTINASTTEPLRTTYEVKLNAGPQITRKERLVFQSLGDALDLAALLNL